MVSVGSSKNQSVSRVLLLDLDSVKQSERLGPLIQHDSAGLKQAICDIMGMIRTALLVSDELLITDSMLLDGIFFALHSPTELAIALDVPIKELPMTFVCEGGSLSNSLKSKRSRPDFEWQLDKYGLTPQEMERHWNAWLEFEQTLSFEGYRKSFRLPEPDPRWLNSLPPCARRRWDEMFAVTERSKINKLKAAYDSEESDDEEDTGSLFECWGQAYLAAMADSLEANWLMFDVPEAARKMYLDPAHESRRQLGLSTDLVTLASQMTPSVFGTVRYQTRTLRERLGERPSGSRMRNLTFGIKSPLSQPGRIQVLVSSVTKILIAVLAVAVAFPVEGAVPTNVIWIGFLATALSTIPWESVKPLLSALKPEKAILSISNEGSHDR